MAVQEDFHFLELWIFSFWQIKLVLNKKEVNKVTRRRQNSVLSQQLGCRNKNQKYFCKYCMEHLSVVVM